MEDVVLHYRPGSAAGLGSLVQRTERLLESFPLRTPPVFSPWFPSAADPHPPIRPARPAPVITCSGAALDSHAHAPQTSPQGPQRPQRPQRLQGERAGGPAELTRGPPEGPQRPPEAVPEPPNPLVPVPVPVRHRGSPETHTDPPIRRSWSVFTQRGVLPTPPTPSKTFHHTVSKHRLQLHQRGKWVISQGNCGGGRDIEQVWRALSRCVRAAGLPSCNANIQRERAEIWVFCDVVHAEQVGRHLKEALQLSGRIGLSVRRKGNVFSM